MKRAVVMTIIISLLFSCWVFPAQGDDGSAASIELTSCDELEQFHFFGAKTTGLESRTVDGKPSKYVTFEMKSFSFGTASTTFDAVDVSAYPTNLLGLQLTLYVSDKNGVVDELTGETSGSIQLASPGETDTENCYTWDLAQCSIRDGFQEICLPFSAAKVTGSPDLTKLNYFRFMLDSVEAVTIGLDSISVISVPAESYFAHFASSSQANAWSIDNGAQRSYTDTGMRLSLGSGKTTLRIENSQIASFPTANTLMQLGLEDVGKGIESITLRLGKKGTEQTAEVTFTAEELSEGGSLLLSKHLSQATASADFSLPQINTAEIIFNTTGKTTLTLTSFGVGERAALLEYQIASIDMVTSDNYLQLGPKLELAEQELAVTMEELGIVEDEIDADASDHVANYFALVDAREEYDNCVSEAKKGVSTLLKASSYTVASGDTVAVEYRISNIGDYEAEYRYALTYSVMYGTLSETSDSLEGSLIVDAGESKTFHFEFLAREGGVLNIDAKLYSSRYLRLSNKSAMIQITGAGVYLGDMHTHSVESDGKGTLAQNYHQMVKKGMSVIYSTDHNAKVSNKSNLHTATQAMNASGYRFLALKGSEITVYANNGHMLSYDHNIDFTEPPRIRTQEAIDNWNSIIDTINKSGGYAYLAHPMMYWYNYPGFASDAVSSDKANEVEFYDDILDLYTEMTGMEIINVSYTSTNANNDRTIAYWYRMNCKGHKKYFGAANSDAHTPSGVASAYNGFLMDDLTTESFLDAHRNGRFFATTGPEMRFTLDDKTFGQTLLTADDKAQLKAEVYTDTGNLTEVVLLDYTINAEDPDGAYENGVKTMLYQYEDGGEKINHLTIDQEIEVQNGHFYSIEVYTSNRDKVAFANPIWVYEDARGDINADGDVNASDALLALQKSVRLISFELRESEMADVDLNGSIDASDALKILQKSVGLISSFE